MSGDQIVQLIAVFGALVLVSSGLAVHRLSWSKGLRMGLMWAGLFVIATLFISIVTEQ